MVGCELTANASLPDEPVFKGGFRARWCTVCSMIRMPWPPIIEESNAGKALSFDIFQPGALWKG